MVLRSDRNQPSRHAVSGPMQRTIPLFVLVVMTACVAGSPQASSSAARPTPSPATSSQFPVAAPTLATPTVATPTPPSPSASASPATGLTCQLPVVVGSTPGFVTFPGGSFKGDPQPNLVRVPQSSPYAQVLIYDRPFNRWLNVPWWLVSPDGTRYVYRGSDGSVHLAAVSGASDQVVVGAGVSGGNGWFPVGITGPIVYVAATPKGSGPMSAPYFGLWSVNADGSSLKPITQSGTWTVIGKGAAWGVENYGLSLNRLDLSTGAVVAWYAQPNSVLLLYDLDSSGNPVVGVAGAGQSSFVVGVITGQNTLNPVALPSGTAWGTYGHSVQNALAAQAGIWLTMSDGGLLYAPQGATFQLMADIPGIANVGAGCH